jgi:hypothetical protein
MRKPLFAFILLFLSCLPAWGQDNAERLVLRTLLGVPANTPVTTAASADMPVEEPLKVYLEASGDTQAKDQKVKDNLAQAIDEWNKGEGAQNGTLEVVTDPAQARVALIQYTDYPTEIEDSGAIGSSAPAIGQTENAPSINNIKMTMIIYTYIIMREPNSLKVLYRRKETLITKTQVLMNPRQTNVATAKLRKEIDKALDKRTAQKDATQPDKTLRDEFLKLLRSRSKSLKK